MGSKDSHSSAIPDLSRTLVGISHNIRQVREQIDKYSQTEDNILVLGETSTGKGVIARAIHERSERRKQPMEVANLPDYPETLIESALFGHSKDAYTGATKEEDGIFRRADGRVLFLDEIADAPKKVQAALLGAIEKKEFPRVGDGKIIESSFTLISATNKPVEEDAKKGGERYLRLDLFARLRQKVIRVKPLKERREDILPLMSHFLALRGIRFNELYLWWLSVYDLLLHSWPMNVRELQYLCENSEIQDRDGKRVLSYGLDEIPSSSFDNDKRSLPPPIIVDGDSWGFELVQLKAVDQAIQEQLKRRSPWQDSEPVVSAVLIALAKRLVSLQKYEKVREEYLREKEERAEKAEELAGETGGIPSRSRSLMSTLTGSPDLSDYFSRPKTKSSGEVQDDAIRTLVKEGVKLPDLTTRFVDEFLKTNPITGKTGQKLSSRAKQLGIDAKTLRKHWRRIKLATISFEGLFLPKPKRGQKTESHGEQKRSREP